jgi:hypothetical protein
VKSIRRKAGGGIHKESHRSETNDGGRDGMGGEGDDGCRKSGNPFRMVQIIDGMGRLQTVEVTSLCGNQHGYAQVMCA